MLQDLDEYASLILKEKNNYDIDVLRKIVKNKLKMALNELYYAVALDIDGTITQHSKTDIPEQLLEKIVEILNSRVYIILITGRGRGSSKKIIQSILNHPRLISGRQKYLLTITGHGCHLLVPNPENNNIDEEELLINKNISEILNFKNMIEENIFYKKLKKDEKIDITLEPCGLRILIKKEPSRKEIEKLGQILNDLIEKENKKLKKEEFHLIKSKYKENIVLEVSISDKNYALNYLYSKYDFHDVPILRIGDQGAEKENDYTLLDTEYGFSVGTISKIPHHCFPVINYKKERMIGPEGTLLLLNTIKTNQRLTISPFLVKKYRFEYLKVNDRLKKEASRYMYHLKSEWLKKAMNLFGKNVSKTIENNNFKNIIDRKSGGITFDILEWITIPEDIPLKKFFNSKIEIKDLNNNIKQFPRILLTDTKILLRSYTYYWGLAFPKENYDQKEIFIEIIKENLRIYENLLNMINTKMIIYYTVDLNDKKDFFIFWKLLMGILDNFRNNSLIIFSLIFKAVIMDSNVASYWKPYYFKFKKHVEKILKLYYDCFRLDLTNIKEKIKSLHEELEIYYKLYKNIELLFESLNNYYSYNEQFITRWREADNPVTIYSTMLYSLEKHLVNILENNIEEKKIIALGIMNGGVELPFVLKILGKSHYNLDIKAELIGGISFYSNRTLKKLRKPLSREEIARLIPIEGEIQNFMNKDDIVIILDDNIMTGRTVEYVRYLLLTLGVSVPKIITVKYPGENRLYQMMMKNHGGPNPSFLGDVIIGLMEETPYSRIGERESRENKYKDITNVFDLSKERIVRYLKKNQYNLLG